MPIVHTWGGSDGHSDRVRSPTEDSERNGQQFTTFFSAFAPLIRPKLHSCGLRVCCHGQQSCRSGKTALGLEQDGDIPDPNTEGKGSCGQTHAETFTGQLQEGKKHLQFRFSR